MSEFEVWLKEKNIRVADGRTVRDKMLGIPQRLFPCIIAIDDLEEFHGEINALTAQLARERRLSQTKDRSIDALEDKVQAFQMYIDGEITVARLNQKLDILDAALETVRLIREESNG